MRSKLSDVAVYEVYTKDGECAGSTFDVEPDVGRKALGAYHKEISGAEASVCAAVFGFYTHREAVAYGLGARDTMGCDVVGFVAKRIADDLSVCLIEHFKGDPGLNHFDYRDTIDPPEDKS